ncbi:hypothetical protein KDW_19700 [Dictyobacter vulcani]|uniref:Mannosyl-glycoprotein endo-beta-N-acetylglucosamidase-like domain-containing protein n=1 Tax=Dictyobacter vulcani TaxID=2607529 RepID=A0A5J4KES6_9CHLR|nr:glucosaminidase domain-containing protein [Dictyobacter vulcani]GER87808.1 hypothetical protein KDW_19700 [Dictyobacter vulcani]
MASGNYAKKSVSPATTEIRSAIPARATRDLSAVIDTAGDEPLTAETYTFTRESASVKAPVRTEGNPNRTGKTATTRITNGGKTGATTRITSSGKAGAPPTRVLSTDVRAAEATRVLTRELRDTNSTQVLDNLRTEHNTRILPNTKIARTVDIDRALIHDTPTIKQLEKHKSWLNPWLVCFTFAIISLLVLISAGILQRENTVSFNFGVGQTYSIQVGGSQAKDWQKTQPEPIKKTIKPATGPYAVMGKPTVNADFINKVLSNAGSPAAGKGQVFYDLGVQYGIDPVFALAFFQHESTFGTRGEARKTLSIGNLRCIQNHECVDKNASGDGYAQMDSWDDGIKTWYSLIRNFYVIDMHKDTIEKIIPTYAPSSDNNNEAAYISSLKASIDSWRAGVL